MNIIIVRKNETWPWSYGYLDFKQDMTHGLRYEFFSYIKIIKYETPDWNGSICIPKNASYPHPYNIGSFFINNGNSFLTNNAKITAFI
jgi:hypothetical protein